MDTIARKVMDNMYRIIDGRGSGKTSRLMLLAKEHNGVLVCANPYAMKEKAYGYGLTGFDIISYEDYINKSYDTKKPCFVDELERLVSTMCFGLTGYTISEDD